MGWNQIHNLQDQLFTGIQEKSYVYFVHSYYGQVTSHTTAITEYGNSFSAAAVKDNFYAVQFHPEKSGSVGEQILQNFLEL
jgi:glutamine amidotransferase